MSLAVKKLLVKTYGCQMNEYDSQRLTELMTSTHLLIATEKEQLADLIILNTCAIRAKASEKLFSELGRLRKIKKTNPKLIIAVGGCVSMIEKEQVFKRAPYTDIVFGPQTIHLLPQLYKRALAGQTRIIDTSLLQLVKFDQLPPLKTTKVEAYVTIMEGCNKFCSYCIVPFTRGQEKSRTTESILNEVKTLLAQGAKEIHLLGQNVNSYCDPSSNNRLSSLITKIAEFSEVDRIRFTTSHPANFTQDLIDLYQAEPKLSKQLHLPIQSGSDQILKLMRRGYTSQDYLQLVAKLRQAVPNLSLSSDFIVGFPDETAQDFEATLQIVNDIDFSSSYSFIFSPRPHTAAAKMEDSITLSEKKERLKVLQDLLATQARSYHQQMTGTIQQALVTEMVSTSPPYRFIGKIENNKTVTFSAPTNCLGKIVSVKITEALPNSLVGELNN